MKNVKVWHIAALFVVLGIAYVLISRPTIPNKVGASPYTSNDLFGALKSLGNFGSAVVNKFGAPSATPDVGGNEGTYYIGTSAVDGNRLTSGSGEVLTYGTD